MSRSNDPGHFFLSEDAISKGKRQSAKASNKRGDPYKLSSKGLAVIAVPAPEGNQRTASSPAAAVYVAESTGVITKLHIEPWKRTATYRGPSAPLTCLCLSPDGLTLYSGCWDKRIYAWDVRSKALVHKFLGHADFVKAVACVTLSTTSDSQLSGNSGSSDKSQSGTLQLLASGSADGAIIVWNAATEEILQKLRGHARGVQDLLVWPSTTPAPITTTTTTTIITVAATAAAAAGERERAAALSNSSAVLLSAGSEREIKRWLLEYEPVSKTVRGRLLGEALLFHETSVYRMRLSGPRGPDEQDQDQDQNQDAEQEADVGAGGGWELYTASADKSVAVIRGMGPLRGEGRVSRRLDHPDFVRDVLLAVRDDDYYPGHMQFVVTACRDEDIRVWNNPGELGYRRADLMSGGQADDPSELLYTLSGHFDEVCGLVAVGNRLVSVSIDCTVRRWGLTSAEMEAVERAAERDEGIEGAGGAKLVEEADVKGVALTAEEEAELADLMD